MNARALDLASLRLEKGAHGADSTFCVMEAVAYIAGEPWSDHPRCSSPVITAYCLALNDRMPDTERQRLVAYIPRLVDTREPRLERRRAYLCADWAARRFAPLALEAAGLAVEADRLRQLKPIVNRPTAAAAAEAAAETAAAAGPRAATWTAWTAAASGTVAAASAAAASAAAARASAAAEAARASEAARWDEALALLDALLELK
jgi:hypothetical protein